MAACFYVKGCVKKILLKAKAVRMRVRCDFFILDYVRNKGRNMNDIEKKKNKILNLINDKNYKPLKQKELIFLLQVPQEAKEEFREILAQLVEEGKIILTKRGKYQSISDYTKTGVYTGHQKGFGFVTVEGEEEDYYISSRYTMGALNRDKVMIRMLSSSYGKRKEAEIVRIVERANTEVVGYYQKRKNFGFVIPDDKRFGEDIYIPKKKGMDAVTGHKVVVRLTSYGDKNHKPEGEVIEVLGHVNDPGTDILSIIRGMNLPGEFPEDVVNCLDKIPDSVTEDMISDRTDLRRVLMVTIDGEDAKDLDDAVSLNKTGNGYELGVHIADVSNYVKEKTSLDREALNRGTSIYLADRVIPMLPHKLSNGICSLNAGEDRLALSCIMDIDFDGRITGHKILETVICVDKRMSYDEVYKVLENEMSLGDEFDELLFNMNKLSGLLREKRRERGSIDFDLPEAEINLDEYGNPIDIGVRERNTAHKIIEDFMLAANETIAEDYYWQELPFEYRVHEKPDGEKLKKLKLLTERFGYYFKAGNDSIHPKEIQKLLDKIEGTEEEDFISRMTLRSMQQARYSTSCDGHFGLATRYYCHFTSPIRRYPDLQIHRIIKENLHGRLTKDRISHYNDILSGVAESNSKRERIAEEAEREVIKLKKVQYMIRHLGEVYEGIVSGVTGFGLFVELPNTVEGLVKINTIPDDYYIYDEGQMMIYGRSSGMTYQMGQKVTVMVTSVDKKLLTIDFEIVSD